MNLTKRNHYNPCFWTAHWNPAYFELVRKDEQHKPNARKQQVFVLNIKSNSIYQQSVENVHYDKHLGITEINSGSAKDFCKRNFPDQYDEFCKDIDADPETLYLDFENILTELERTPAYTTLLNVIQRGTLSSGPEKGVLAGFIAVHLIRSHALMQSMVELTDMAGVPKFEYFWMLKNFLSNTDQLFRFTIALTSGLWQFYRTYQDTFPLTDTPVLLQPGSVMVALSPRLLLEIDRTDKSCENGWVNVNYISSAKLEEFRRRTIGNTFREIIFGAQESLEQWKATPEFDRRHALMADTTTYNEKVAKYLNGEIWKINAHGNMLL